MKFENVAFYLAGEFFGSINRYDCKTLEITVIKYAQYDNAVKIVFLRKGKRKLNQVILSNPRLAMVLLMSEAVDPDPLYVYGPPDANGTRVGTGKYPSFDPRWESDFRNKVKEAGATVLFRFGVKHE